MKRIILCLSLFEVFGSQAQQINPVPDYVFSNKMSVGRNAVTDTAAYFSIGPRYGAIRGMMPPMVTDTASMSATKRNGLLIFSIQKNKYLYWDSVGSKWAEMAGTAGSAITGSGVAGYMPEFTTATNIDTTRLYHSNGRFAIGSTTTTNGVFNVYGGQSYFDTSLKVGSQTLLADEGKNEVYVNTTSDAGDFKLQVIGNQYISGTQSIGTTTAPIGSKRTRYAYEGGIEFERSDGGQTGLITTFNSYDLLINNNNASITMERISGKIFLNPANTNEVYVNTSTDAGAYALQVAGAMYATGNLNFAGGDITISNISNNVLAFGTNNTERMRLKADGEVLIGTTTDAGVYALQVTGAIYNTTTITTGAPSGGTAKPFKIGAAATVSPTSPNRTIEIEIDGTTYYIHAKTTND